MSRPTDPKPASVSTVTSPAGSVLDRWIWAEPAVWTERMLTALEQGVKGGVWYSLIDKVYDPGNLAAAYAKVASNDGAAGVDHVTIDQFADRLETNLEGLHRGLRDDSYVPQAALRCWIPKPGSTELRPLSIPTVRDRVVQAALRQVIEPIFERDFAQHSYGFRPGKGCKDALRQVNALLKSGFTHVVDVDLKSYFDTIPHDRLLSLIRRKVSDGRVLSLIEAFLHQGVMDGLSEWTPEEGTPQGAVISPLLSNIYLDPLDHLMAEAGFAMVRYADDFVVLCRSPEEAKRALAAIQEWVSQAGLTLHPTKTRIVEATTEGFDFLGYHFRGQKHWPRKKSMKKLKDNLRSKTHRSNGKSLERIIDEVNSTLRGWFGYFKHSLKYTFEMVDRLVRVRLRSILRKRAGLRGRGRGKDHQRWKNSYFEGMGLYSLKAAHAELCQSSSR